MSRAWAYYNEFDPKAAAWLRELIRRDLIAPGEVDERSIADVAPDDILGFTQHHFFAGIGGWSLGLRLAGWPDDRPVWTGSCPCPPFSAAGKGSECPSCGGRSCLSHPLVTAGWICLDCGDEWRGDDRHLLPEFIRLLGAAAPASCFGEQVASRDGLLWLETLRATMAVCGHAVLAADLPAAGFGSPQIRQRLFWRAERLADADCGRQGSRDWHDEAARHGAPAAADREPRGLADAERGAAERHGHTLGAAPGALQGAARQQRLRDDARHGDPARRLGDGLGAGLEGHGRHGDQRDEPGRLGPDSAGSAAAAGAAGWLADADGRDASAEREQPGGKHGQQPQDGGVVQRGGPGPTAGFWRDPEWLLCRDELWRPVEPGTFPLAHGLPARVGRLRGYGNAIVPQVAAAFIRASEEALAEAEAAGWRFAA